MCGIFGFVSTSPLPASEIMTLLEQGLTELRTVALMGLAHGPHRIGKQGSAMSDSPSLTWKMGVNL